MQDLGVALVAYSPLGRGLIAGRIRTLNDLAPDDWRRQNPRFDEQNLAKNLALADLVREIASEKGCSLAQLALAWLLSKPGVIPIPGTSSLDRLKENSRATELKLADDEIAAIEQALPKGTVAGARYDSAMLGLVDR